MEVIIYSKNNCPNCLKAKNILSKYKPKILILEKDISREDFFKKFPAVRKVPQIVINNQHIGGYEEVEKWLALNQLIADF